MAFVRGVIDGWALRESTEDNVSSGAPTMTNGIRPKGASDLARMLDVAYANEENLNLPIGWVLMGSLAVQRGETTTALVMQRLRRHLADIAFGGLPSTAQKLNPSDAISSATKSTP
jgi:hypothetical protein